MKVTQAANLWLNYYGANSSQNTIRACKELMERFCKENGDKNLKELTSDDVWKRNSYSFLKRLPMG